MKNNKWTISTGSNKNLAELPSKAAKQLISVHKKKRVSIRRVSAANGCEEFLGLLFRVIFLEKHNKDGILKTVGSFQMMLENWWNRVLFSQTVQCVINVSRIEYDFYIQLAWVAW